jgi:TRAP-type C4-dicarboxylate transport system permease large subunit
MREALKICGEALWGLMAMVIILGGILSGFSPPPNRRRLRWCGRSS